MALAIHPAIIACMRGGRAPAASEIAEVTAQIQQQVCSTLLRPGWYDAAPHHVDPCLLIALAALGEQEMPPGIDQPDIGAPAFEPARMLELAC